MLATIFLLLASVSQTATLIAVEPAGVVKYCIYERNDDVWELEVLVDEICPAIVNTIEEQDDA